MLRASFWLLAVTLGVLSRPAAQAQEVTVPVRTYTGYYNDTAVYFTAFETNNLNFASVNNLNYAPRLTQVDDLSLPQMIFFMNGGGQQTVVLETEPGQANYNPLWRVVNAFWQGTGPMPLITSFAAAAQYNQQGQLAVQRTGIVMNAPVITINRPLDLSNIGTVAPTISPMNLVSIDPATRTAYLRGEQGYYNGQLVTFLALEHAPGEIQDAPGAIPVPTISVNALGDGAVADFYEFDNQPPVIDSIPLRQVAVTNPGTTTPPATTPPATTYGAVGPAGKSTEIPSPPQAYGQPVAGQTGGQVGGQTGGQVGGQTGGQTGGQAGSVTPAAEGQYSPIWHVHHVTFRAGVTPFLLRSVAEIQQAASLGQVDIIQGQSDDTFNCPIPFFYTIPTGGTTPIATPIYTAPTNGTGGTTPAPPAGAIPVTPTPVNPNPTTTTPPTTTIPGGTY